MWRAPVKIFLFAVILIIVCGMVLLLTSYRYWLKPKNLMDSQIESHIDIGLNSVHHVAVRNGHKLWDLSSESVHRIKAENYVSPLTLTVYPYIGDPITLNAKNGIVYDNKNIKITEDIVVKQSPWKFVCDSLMYYYTRHEIIGKQNIAITGCGLTITAKAINYDLSSGLLTVTESVGITISEPNSIHTGYSK